MTPDRVAEALAVLEAAEKAATPGPWWATEPLSTSPQTAHAVARGSDAEQDHQLIVITLGECDEGLDIDETNREADAEFIAKFRNAAPALLTLAGAANEVLDGGHHNLRHQKCNYCGMTWP